ncbi:transposase [Clostridiales bacterium PH28_bin88]|nr:transposase [Clostridiales bacterium PH28_bin88]
MNKLDTNNHSVFLLTYHLLICVKYRRKAIDDQIAARIQEIGEYVGNNYHITFLEYNHDRDHIHILFKAHPNTEISKYINAFKSASSRLIKKEFPHVRKMLWKETFWSPSYCLLTTGGAPLETLQKYIESQGKE